MSISVSPAASPNGLVGGAPAGLGSLPTPIPIPVIRGLSDRSYDKRKSSALELEIIIKEDPSPDVIRRIVSLLRTDLIESTQSNLRKGGLIGLAAVAIGLTQTCYQFLDDILPPVILLMHDQEVRCRYYSCEAIYNIVKVSRGHSLKYFNGIYSGLCTLHADSDEDVRNGAALLDRLMKDIVTESDSFDIESFIPLLEERIFIQDSDIRELNIGWIQVLDSVPDIDLLQYLPRFLGGIFQMLRDPKPSIVQAADSVLKDFLLEINSSRSATIESMVPLLVDLGKTPGSAPVIKLSSLSWLEEFVVLCKARLLPLYPTIIGAVLNCVNDADTDICIRAEKVNASMMEQVQIGSADIGVDALLSELIIRLHLTSNNAKISVLNWIYMLLVKHPEALLKSLDNLFPPLIGLLSDPVDEVVRLDLRVLATISRNPTYFDAVFQRLVHVLLEDRSLLDSRGPLIIQDLSSLLDGQTVYRAIARLLPASEEGSRLESMSVLIQTLNILLLTSNQLYELRRVVQGCLLSDSGSELFETLFRSWCHNPCATLSLCLLAEAYELASSVVYQFANLQVTVGFLIEIDRLVQLIESSVFIRLRLQLLEPNQYPFLFKALHGILMVLPQGAAFKALSSRLHSVSSLSMLNALPSSSSAAVDVIPNRPIQILPLLAQYKAVQLLYTRARNKALNEKQIRASTSVNVNFE